MLLLPEVLRAGQFHFERDRSHFTRSHPALRSLLAGCLTIPAIEIRFEYLTSGNPQLATEQNPRRLPFNLPHSASMALIAVGGAHRLGVDVKKISSDVDTALLAERFFSLREGTGLQVLPDSPRANFFACWTRREAFLKVTGTRFSFPLADFPSPHTLISVPHSKKSTETRKPGSNGLWPTSASSMATERRRFSIALILAWKPMRGTDPAIAVDPKPP